MTKHNIGKTGTTVTVSMEPDQTGNFICSGALDHVELREAVVEIDRVGGGSVNVKQGTYDISALTIDTPIKFLGEKGTIFNLTAQSAITLTADATEVFFEEITFLTTVDTFSHMRIQNPSLKFEHCKFDFQVDLGIELQGVMNCNAASPNRVEFLNCELIAGKAGASYFGVMKIANDMSELILRDFVVTSLTVDHAAPNRISLFEVDTGQNVGLIELKNIDIKGYNCPEAVGGAFIGVHGTADSIVIDGYLFRGGTWTNGVNVYHTPLQMFGVATNVTISNMELHQRFHPVVQAQRLTVNNFIGVGDGGAAMFDCGSSTATECDAVFTNVYAKNFSLDFNTGWRNLTLNGFVMDGCRVNILDEGSTKGQEKNVIIGDGSFNSRTGDKYGSQIAIAYGQTVNLNKLQVTNVLWDRVSGGNITAVQPSGVSAYATHLIFDNIVVKNRDYSWPRWISGTGRNNDNQVVWVFNSEITTYVPPLGDWNPIRDNDRFDNVKWIRTTDGAITYSEQCGKATILNGQPSITVTHNLVSPPDYIPASDLFGNTSITGVGNHTELTELCVDNVGATTFDIVRPAGAVSANRDVFWKASITAFAG